MASKYFIQSIVRVISVFFNGSVKVGIILGLEKPFYVVGMYLAHKSLVIYKS